jgi:hypothetical protein
VLRARSANPDIEVKIEIEPAGSMQISQRRRRVDPMGGITLLIQRARAGDASALAGRFERLYPERRRVGYLRPRLGAALH